MAEEVRQSKGLIFDILVIRNYHFINFFGKTGS